MVLGLKSVGSQVPPVDGSVSVDDIDMGAFCDAIASTLVGVIHGEHPNYHFLAIFSVRLLWGSLFI